MSKKIIEKKYKDIDDMISSDPGRKLPFWVKEVDKPTEAHASAAKSLEIFPYAPVSMMAQTFSYKDKAFSNKLLDAMRKAGFPK
jgi:hypothetical protein